jgi:hypothetical protein
MTKQKLTYAQVFAWAKQIEDDAVRCIEARGTQTPAAIDAYRAGVREGVNQMRATLVMHGHLVIVDSQKGGK